MIGEDLRVGGRTQPPEQGRRALDVGEQKRERLHGHSVEGQLSAGAAHGLPVRLRYRRPCAAGILAAEAARKSTQYPLGSEGKQ